MSGRWAVLVFDENIPLPARNRALWAIRDTHRVMRCEDLPSQKHVSTNDGMARMLYFMHIMTHGGVSNGKPSQKFLVFSRISRFSR